MISAFIALLSALHLIAPHFAAADCKHSLPIKGAVRELPGTSRPFTPVQTRTLAPSSFNPCSHPLFAFTHAVVSCVQGWLKQLQLPSGLDQQGPAPAYAALSALCAYLKRMRADQELASGVQQSFHWSLMTYTEVDIAPRTAMCDCCCPCLCHHLSIVSVNSEGAGVSDCGCKWVCRCSAGGAL